ncbi:uncharacterized protein si:ch211-151h10.2 isoform X2 [Nothobranchius furzeri]|uniref:Transcript variant X2 n=1 Tax=Nothobranchius furzeri TaxID=105023 RepID=A0A9D2YHL6_NOTFU|nr:uncharacterized protein si:ch211-151h10.2 isoform X2 [Nothobranchius furzeri]KAF7219544.1 transcript variant X2 [Nothobranchius furzeri]
MPLLADVHYNGQRATRLGETGGRDRTGKWTWEVMEGEGREEAERNQQQQRNRLNPRPDEHKLTFWDLRTSRPWSSLASVGVLWFLFQLEVLRHPSLPLEDLFCRLILLCVLWLLLGACFHGLRFYLRTGPTQVEPPQMSMLPWILQTRSPDAPLTIALTHCLLLCVLQEPLQDPSVSHIKALLSKLEAVAHMLQSVGPEVDQASAFIGSLKLLCSYLQQRTASLRALVQVQEDLEVSVKDLLQGFGGLWTQLEELHTGVTLGKQEGQGHRDPSSVQTDSETLVAELGRYKNKLQMCEVLLKDSTQLLQELTWSHSHVSAKVNSSSESVWPEILLQSNIEQFDKVQESFTSLDQQTATFQTHLEGLGKGTHNGSAGPLIHVDEARLTSVAPQTSQHVSGVSLTNPASAKTQPPPSLRGRSAVRISNMLS